MAWWDWLIVSFIFLLANYLVFAPALKTVGLYYSFGPWKWGLDSSSAVYLLFLTAATYIFIRLIKPKLARGKINIFRELVENLHLTKQYDELVLLVEPQIKNLISILNEQPLLVRIIEKLYTPPVTYADFIKGKVIENQSRRDKFIQKATNPIKTYILNKDKSSIYAREVLLNILTSPELTHHLSQRHPYFCLKLIEADEYVRTDFIDGFISSLLDVPGGRLYVELKNNRNISFGKRLVIPETNRLLYFFFADAETARKRAIYRSIGETLCCRLDEDNKLSAKLNGPLGSYSETGRFSCPIYSGITLFEIMVHEGIHQGLQDHLWLHYFSYFADKTIKQMKVQDSEDYTTEWQTPFHYLLCHLFSVAVDWTEECYHVSDDGLLDSNKISGNLDKKYISKEAAKVIGSMLVYVVQTDKLSEKTKTDILDTVVSCYTSLKSKKLHDVASVLSNHAIKGFFNSSKYEYREKLHYLFNKLDHYQQAAAIEFEAQIEEALS